MHQDGETAQFHLEEVDEGIFVMVEKFGLGLYGLFNRFFIFIIFIKIDYIQYIYYIHYIHYNFSIIYSFKLNILY